MSEKPPGQKNVTTDAIVTVDWMDEKRRTIIITYHKDGWTWADFDHVLKKQFELINAVDHTVDVIVDVNNTHLLPRGGSLVSGLRKLNASHERQGYTIIAGSTGALAVIARNLMKLARNQSKFQFADNLEEATALLQKLRA